jgi:hypothetical protein
MNGYPDLAKAVRLSRGLAALLGMVRQIPLDRVLPRNDLQRGRWIAGNNTLIILGNHQSPSKTAMI